MIDLSARTYAQLFFGDRLREYSDILSEVIRVSNVRASSPDYAHDSSGERMARHITKSVPAENGSLLLVFADDCHAPWFLRELHERYNVRYFSPFSGLEYSKRAKIVSELLNDGKRGHRETGLTHAARHDILNGTFPDSEKPYAVIIGDMRGRVNDGIKHLPEPGKLRERGITTAHAALQGFLIGDRGYCVEDIREQFPTGTFSRFLPELRGYLDGAVCEGIDVRVVPIQHLTGDCADIISPFAPAIAIDYCAKTSFAQGIDVAIKRDPRLLAVNSNTE